MSRAANPSKGGATPTKGAVMPVSRILVILFAVVAAFIVYFELRARSGFNETRQAVDAAMAAGEAKGDGLYKKDVDQYLQGSPVRESPEKDVELFIWNGVLQSYQMRLEYGDGGFIQKANWY